MKTINQFTVISNKVPTRYDLLPETDVCCRRTRTNVVISFTTTQIALIGRKRRRRRRRTGFVLKTSARQHTRPYGEIMEYGALSKCPPSLTCNDINLAILTRAENIDSPERSVGRSVLRRFSTTGPRRFTKIRLTNGSTRTDGHSPRRFAIYRRENRNRRRFRNAIAAGPKNVRGVPRDLRIVRSKNPSTK